MTGPDAADDAAARQGAGAAVAPRGPRGLEGLRAAGIALCVGAAFAGSVDAQVLERLRWTQRVLLMLAPAVDDPRAAALRETLARRACEAGERDLVLLEIPSAGPASLAGSALPPEDAARVRERFHDGGAFEVLLLGKDGGVKLRESRIPDLDEVFALIDGMPMRRAEMRERASACPG